MGRGGERERKGNEGWESVCGREGEGEEEKGQ